ncbi:MAG: DUF4296 domain-containing protein [Chitinophagaceae bacterium]
MRKSLFFIYVLTAFSACKNSDKIPKEILPVSKMKEILRDMMQADIFVNDYVISRNPALNKDSIRIAYYSDIFSIYNISKEAFQKNFNYYKTNPQQMKIVMDSISISGAPTQIVSPLDIADTIQNTGKPVKPAISADTTISKPLNRKQLQKHKF